MKKRVLLFVLLASALTVAANEYIDPETKVVYTYDPKGTTAAVKAGYDMPPFDDEGSRSGIITDGGEIEYYPGSPEASGDIVILDKFVVDGKEYTVTAIGIRAFYECRNITSVVIPQTITTIDYLAFASCRSLAKVYSMIEDPFEICCFDGLASPSTLYVPVGTKAKYLATMGWNVFDSIEEMDEQPQTSQEPLLSEDKCWTMNYKLAVPNGPTIIEETVLRGDTIINGIHFMKRYVRECRQGEELPETWNEWSYIGQEGSKIYLYNSSTKELNPIMDFGLNVGDVFTLYTDEIDLRVKAVTDTIIASSSDKRARKCLYLEMELFGECTEADIWVEGIGSLIYGITGMNVMYTGSDSHLEKCVEEDRILYSRSGDATGIGDAERLNDKGEMINDKRGGVYDLQGRKLTQKPQKGIYILNGRKVVVK